GAGGSCGPTVLDGAVEDIFELQDRVTERVVGAIAPKLEQAEIERAKRKPTGSLDAYDYYLRGQASIHPWTREGHEEALKLFYRAIKLDPGFASAYAMAAWCLGVGNHNLAIIYRHLPVILRQVLESNQYGRGFRYTHAQP